MAGAAAISSHYMYQICTNVGYMEVWDIQNPQPSVIQRFGLPQGNLNGLSHRLFVKGHYLFDIFYVNQTFETIFVYDITNPASPTLVNSYRISDGVGSHTGGNYTTVCFSGNTLYYFATIQETRAIVVWVLDITDPVHIALLNATNGTILAIENPLIDVETAGCHFNAIADGGNYVVA